MVMHLENDNAYWEVLLGSVNQIRHLNSYPWFQELILDFLKVAEHPQLSEGVRGGAI